MSGTGPRSGPAGATAPARRKARKPSERSERPASEGKQKNHRRLRERKYYSALVWIGASGWKAWKAKAKPMS